MQQQSETEKAIEHVLGSLDPEIASLLESMFSDAQERRIPAEDEVFIEAHRRDFDEIL